MFETAIDPSRESSEPKSKSRVGMWLAIIVAVLVVAVIGIGSLTRTAGRSSHASSATFDPCQELRRADPHCGWKAHWEHSGGSVSAMDGTRTEFIELESTDPDGMVAGDLRYATLRLCFENGSLCHGKTIGVGIAVHGMLASVGYESEYSTPVRIRFDDGAPVRRTWGISDNHEMLFPHGGEKQFAMELAKHQKLVVEFSYYEKAPRTVTFEIAGLDEAVHSHGLRF